MYQQIDLVTQRDEFMQQIVCPWCHHVSKVRVRIGIKNSRMPGSKRKATVRVQRTEIITHECVDPTSVTP